MGGYVLGFEELDRTRVAEAGGKGAQLGELSRIDGIRVPAGFCVTAEAFARVVAEAPIGDRLERLSRVGHASLEAIRALSAEIRSALEAAVLPDELTAAVAGALARIGEQDLYAVRSSGTAEDLPAASFAGQHDSYLDVAGLAAVLQHIRRCWASLFSERAVMYRQRNGFDHRHVQMAVIVQQMVHPDAAGVLFTADPVTGNRTLSSIEAVPGSGEALVSGRMSPDVLEVRDGRVVTRATSGGRSVLTEAQAVRLAELGRRIEARFDCPQDIEWCLADGDFQFLQARPITALFPIPDAGDCEKHVYVSVGHQQMMTDAMKPLGISVWQLSALRPMFEAGGRLFVDVTGDLASPSSRPSLLEVMGRGDPLVRDALEAIMRRGDFIPAAAEDARPPRQGGAAPAPVDPDPGDVGELIERTQSSIAVLRAAIRTKSGPELFDFILADIQEMKRILIDPRSHRALMAGMEASWWLNEHLEAWLGEKNATDALTQSVPHNVTSEMGLALFDVADAIRPHPQVVAFLQEHARDEFLDELPNLVGGEEARDAIQGFLDVYGMRCPGEIDITRPRWSERPSMLLPLILDHVKNFEPGESRRRFERGLQEAAATEREVLRRLGKLPDGGQKIEQARRMIDRVRAFIGYREYPKYGIVSRYSVYKHALLEEGDRLVDAGLLAEPEDIFYLTFPELHEAVSTRQVDRRLISRRREAFKSYQALSPPRVLTSDGEVFSGAYRRNDLPDAALAGLAVSAGTVDGRARVVLDMAATGLQQGDILVTTYTDPSWTALFVAISGLVTEVGGLMTHGAVIAREYGLPAVVGVKDATRLIRDGQRIRVNGTAGYVEILP